MILESQKFVAEHDKLAAEARKLDRDRRIAPWQIAVLLIGSVTGFIGGIGGIVAALRATGAL